MATKGNKGNLIVETKESVVKFNEPYLFEGQEYTEVDLSEVGEATTNTLMQADKLFLAKGIVDAFKEVNVQYCMIIASLKTEKPIEFFENLRANEAIKIKNIVSGFLFR